MPPRKRNPIAEKLTALIHSGRTIPIPAARMKVSKELICVLTDIKYPTLENVFNRMEISYASMKSLKYAGLVTDKEEADYRKWLEDRKKGKREKAEHSFDKHQEQDEGLDPSINGEGFDSGGVGESDELL